MELESACWANIVTGAYAVNNRGLKQRGLIDECRFEMCSTHLMVK